jgi:hypothetical protein
MTSYQDGVLMKTKFLIHLFYLIEGMQTNVLSVINSGSQQYKDLDIVSKLSEHLPRLILNDQLDEDELSRLYVGIDEFKRHVVEALRLPCEECDMLGIQPAKVLIASICEDLLKTTSVIVGKGLGPYLPIGNVFNLQCFIMTNDSFAFLVKNRRHARYKELLSSTFH